MASTAAADTDRFGPESLEETLRRLLGLQADESLPAIAVAFSGGADSTALLHALAGLTRRAGIRALHVDHGLQERSARWAEHCEATTAAMAVRCTILKAEIGAGDIAREGVEGAARRARYALLRRELQHGECLVTAQHREDQTETLLLQLSRGAGLPGLAAMAPVADFGPGRLVRPLLDWCRADLLDYLEAHDFTWVEDPANRDRRFDRSFLRMEVLPLLRNRWPAIDRNAARSARHLAEGAALLEQLAASDLAQCDAGHGRLGVERLRHLTVARQRNALRHWIRSSGHRVPDSLHMERLLEEVIVSGRTNRRLRIGQIEVRRYRGRLYLDASGAPPPTSPLVLGITDAVALPAGLGRIRLSPGRGPGLDPELLKDGLEIRFRKGGERLKNAPGGPTRRLKQLLQEAGVVPWMRGRIPLLYSGDRLVAVGDLWIAGAYTRPGGLAVLWDGHPPLY